MANSLALLRSRELWVPASKLHVLGEEQKFSPLDITALKCLLRKGLNRGFISEVHGPRSSGRTSISLHVLAAATMRGEICAFIDMHDAFDPVSAHTAGVKLERLIWVRCRGNSEHAIRAADLLLHAGGFGLVLLDLCETAERLLQRIPLSYWYRFQRAIEHTPTILLVCSESSQARSCASNILELKSKLFHWSGKPPFSLLKGLVASIRLRKTSRGMGETTDVRLSA